MPDDQPSQWATPPATLRHPPEARNDLSTLMGASDLPPSLRLLLDDRMYERVKDLARMLSNDTVFTPKHLREKPAACLNVIQQALDWKMNPMFVARSTYETPGGQVGFDGKLVRGILNQSGRFQEIPSMEYCGEWVRLAGKFQMVDSSTGKSKYPRATWTDADAAGMGVRVKGWLKGEGGPRYWPSETEWFYLVQCQPRNSTLWATDPRTQIGYLAIRRFANQAVPEVMGGMLFDVDDFVEASDLARDVTPRTERPQTMADEPGGRSTVTEDATPEPWVVYRENGEGIEFRSEATAAEALDKIMTAAARNAGADALNTVWDNNLETIKRLDIAGNKDAVEVYDGLMRQLQPKEGGDATDTGKTENHPVDTPPPSEEVGAGVLPRSELNPKMPEGAAVPRGATIMVTPPPPPEYQEREVISESRPSGQSASNHDPFWDGASLKIDPPTVKKGARYVIDWPRWPALILPKIRQAWSAQLVNALWADNGENIDLYTQACGDKARDDLSWEFELARERFK